MMRARSFLTRAAAALLVALPAGAQQYGQWSWEAGLGAVKRGYRNEAGGTSTSRLDESDLTLSAGLSGFVLHPALARFRLELETAFSSFESTRSLDTRRWGLSANVGLLPQSAYPSTLYVTRQLYDYSRLTEEDPLTLLGIPDTSTSFGGRLRLRRGWFQGTLLGYDHSWIDYQRETTSGRRDTTFLDWGGASRKFQRHLRLDYRSERFALANFEIRDLTGNFDQRGEISPRWRSETAAVGFHRTLAQLQSSALDSLRLSQRFIHPVRARDILDLSYDGGVASGGAATFQSHGVQGRYRWRPREAWTLSPLAGYALQIAGRERFQAPQLGVAATWTGRRAATDLQVNSGVTYLLIFHGGDARGTDSALGLDIGGSAARGTHERLRTELEGSWTTNRLRVAGETLPQLPDLGASFAGTGTENTLRGRLTFSRRSRGLTALLYADGSRRRPSGSFAQPSVGFETFTNTLQLSGRRFGLTGNLGQSRVLGPGDQDVSFWGASATLRPFWLVGLMGSYRADRRNLALAPRIDGERWEASADVLVGAFVLRGQVFATMERAFASGERTNRGFTLTLTRGFRGWLPIVTGGLTGGEIQ